MQFSTLSIDRFGIGESSHADPLNVVQAPAEVSAIYELTKMLRNGNFPRLRRAFDKVVHVGHSFGSVQSYMLSALDPSASDAIILTGWSNNRTWLPETLADWNVHIARENQPIRFGSPSGSRGQGDDSSPDPLASVIDIVSSLFPKSGKQNGQTSDPVAVFTAAFEELGVILTADEIRDILTTTELGDIINQADAETIPVPQDLPTGYLTWSDYTANQYAFLAPPFFDPAIGQFAESTKQPVTLGELFTLGNGAPETTPFAGPVLVFTGRQDKIYCGGDCLETGDNADSIPGRAASAFPNARSFEAYVHPDTGVSPSLWPSDGTELTTRLAARHQLPLQRHRRDRVRAGVDTCSRPRQQLALVLLTIDERRNKS